MSQVDESVSNMSRMGGAAYPAAFGAKLDDPLIRAETEKKVKEQRGQLENEYRQSIAEIDKNFELRKKEILASNKKDIEREKAKWEAFKKAEEKRIREEAENAGDSKLQAFKEQLRVEEESQMRQI